MELELIEPELGSDLRKIHKKIRVLVKEFLNNLNT